MGGTQTSSGEKARCIRDQNLTFDDGFYYTKWSEKFIHKRKLRNPRYKTEDWRKGVPLVKVYGGRYKSHITTIVGELKVAGKIIRGRANNTWKRTVTKKLKKLELGENEDRR